MRVMSVHVHQDRHKHGTFEELSHDHCLLSKWKHVNRLPHYIHLCSVKTPLRTNFTSAYSQQAIECVPAYRLLTQLCLACVTYIRNDIDTQKLTWKLPLRRRLQTVIQYTFLMCQYPVCICLFNNVFIVCSGGGALDSGRSQTYGMTSAISLAGPTPHDIRLSKTLELTLRSFDMFETDEQMALRLAFLHPVLYDEV